MEAKTTNYPSAAHILSERGKAIKEEWQVARLLGEGQRERIREKEASRPSLLLGGGGADQMKQNF